MNLKIFITTLHHEAATKMVYGVSAINIDVNNNMDATRLLGYRLFDTSMEPVHIFFEVGTKPNFLDN